jgi:hypothetical protein
MEMGAFMCLKAGAKDLHSVNNTDFDRTIGADFLRFFFMLIRMRNRTFLRVQHDTFRYDVARISLRYIISSEPSGYGW